MKINNAKTLPQRYYGLHMAPGVAEYREPGQNPYRIFLNEDTIKKMDATFTGRPVYVGHVEEVDLDKIGEADGFVSKSFYNAADGKHWVEFVVITDKGHEAIRNGWKLSNAYIPKEFAGGGHWHGVEYLKEVKNGEYEHLAIVPDPRYSESVIFTPEQFKKYNSDKELELKKFANSKGDKSVFKFWKREKIENSIDLEGSMVLLPESKKEMPVSEALKVADKFLNMQGYANGDHMIKVGEDEMSVNDLVSKFCDMKKNMEDAEAKKKENEVEEDKKENEEEPKEDKKENADLDGGEKEAEKDKKAADKTENKKKNHFDDLKDAPFTVKNDSKVIHVNKVARGVQLYGSK